MQAKKNARFAMARSGHLWQTDIFIIQQTGQ
jgi:hypothetical protein